MTAAEFKAWSDHTAGSRLHWQRDEIMLHNQGASPYYIGGENGKFISIDKTGKLELGTYEGAVPHIGEALFTITFTKQFADKNAAETRLLECGGIKFFTDMLGFRCYT
jgi:hypothetical protein